MTSSIALTTISTRMNPALVLAEACQCRLLHRSLKGGEHAEGGPKARPPQNSFRHMAENQPGRVPSRPSRQPDNRRRQAYR